MIAFLHGTLVDKTPSSVTLDVNGVGYSVFISLGETDPYFAALAEICGRNNGLWCSEAEEYVLKHAPRLEKDSE